MSVVRSRKVATEDHTSRAHSKLGASIAHRWLACPGSVRASEGIENVSSIFAAQGTAAHELGEKCLRAKFQDPGDFLGEEIVVGNHKFVVDDDMIDAVRTYVEAVKSMLDPGDILLIEHRFNLEHIHPGMFGTGDAGIYKVKTNRLIVIDYKHGQGHAVEAKENPQLAYYGLGMINVDSLKGIALKDVELVIVQPRSPHKDGPVRSWVTTPVHLLDFAVDLAIGAQATEQPDAPLSAGDHCTFCPAAGTCPALRKVAITDAQREFVDVVAEELTDQAIADLLEKCGLISDGIRAIRAEAYRRAATGTKVPGWKIVAMKPRRKWTNDEEETAGRLLLQFSVPDRDALWVKKLKSPAQMEKLLPKPERVKMADLVTKASSGTTLARETDRRPETTAQNSASDDFNPVED